MCFNLNKHFIFIGFVFFIIFVNISDQKNENKVKVIQILPKSDEQNKLITELGIKFKAIIKQLFNRLNNYLIFRSIS